MSLNFIQLFEDDTPAGYAPLSNSICDIRPLTSQLIQTRERVLYNSLVGKIPLIPEIAKELGFFYRGKAAHFTGTDWALNIIRNLRPHRNNRLRKRALCASQRFRQHHRGVLDRGVVLLLEGDVLFKAPVDIFSVVDSSGVRWVDTYELAGGSYYQMGEDIKDQFPDKYHVSPKDYKFWIVNWVKKHGKELMTLMKERYPFEGAYDEVIIDRYSVLKVFACNNVFYGGFAPNASEKKNNKREDAIIERFCKQAGVECKVVEDLQEYEQLLAQLLAEIKETMPK